MAKCVAYLCLLVLLIQLSHVAVAAPATDSVDGSLERGDPETGDGAPRVIYVDDGTPDEDTYDNYDVPGAQRVDGDATPAPKSGNDETLI